MKFRILILLFIAFTLYSCGNNEPSHNQTDGNDETTEETGEDDGDTTALSEAELFSMVLVNDILQGNEETDLQGYLEEEIFPMVQGATKVTLDRLTASVYIMTYEKDGSKSSLLIQKFYDPANEQIVFEKTETGYGLKSQYVK